MPSPAVLGRCKQRQQAATLARRRGARHEQGCGRHRAAGDIGANARQRADDSDSGNLTGRSQLAGKRANATGLNQQTRHGQEHENRQQSPPGTPSNMP